VLVGAREGRAKMQVLNAPSPFLIGIGAMKQLKRGEARSQGEHGDEGEHGEKCEQGETGGKPQKDKKGKKGEEHQKVEKGNRGEQSRRATWASTMKIGEKGWRGKRR